MAVIDDVRRLSRLDVIFLGTQLGAIGSVFTTWYKGRLQQANDGSWVFRSASADGAIVGIQLGPVGVLWTSSETPIRDRVAERTSEGQGSRRLAPPGDAEDAYR